MIHHPNRLPFEGVLTQVDVASNKPPSGARDHNVILTRKAAQAALHSLRGMAVDYKLGWDGHDPRQKCGVITHARIVGIDLRVRGYVFNRDFPEFEDLGKIEQRGPLGMSYELAEAFVADMRQRVWEITSATFVGAAILLRAKAAYKGTSFRIPERPRDLALAAEGLEMVGSE